MQSADRWQWDGPRAAPDFAMIPGFVRREIISRLTGSEWKVLYCLMDRAYQEGHMYATFSLGALQRDCGISRSTALDAIHRLTAKSLIIQHELQPIEGPRHVAVYRLLITADPRYTNRVRGSKIDPGGGSKIDPGVDRKSIRSGGLSSDLYKREERDGDTQTESKYERGRYAVCRRCHSRPCVCEDER